MSAHSTDRRRLLAAGAATLATGAAITWGGSAEAATNAAMRTALKYQDGPKDGLQCNGCALWVAGKTPKDRGSCKVIPGDTEISPTGWCSAWAKATK